MGKIELEHECTAPDGKCYWSPISSGYLQCIGMNDDEEGEVCQWLKAARKIEPK